MATTECCVQLRTWHARQRGVWVDVDAFGELIQVKISEVALIEVEPNDDKEGEDNHGLADAALKARQRYTSFVRC
jgi:hypothetical protein